ncbi:uncharacterized protein [Parasteatoda tepidariorum]|uniref:uncharacterized protein n=1 Tax=Parasteatoda tepidariorum TaxID=114398 RepID=UPI00077F9FEC|nr:uncharacterized protein LOC107451477 [Parasteatoda tepidariorum]
MVFTVGDRFESFSAFLGALEIFKVETNTDFKVYGSKSLDVARQYHPKRLANVPAILKYYNIKFICRYGGNFKRSKSSQGLRNTSTRIIGCEAFIYLTLSEDSKALVIGSLCLEHNHDLTRTFEYVPRKKRSRELRMKLNNIEVYQQEKLKNRKKPLVQRMIFKRRKNVESSVFVTQDLSNLNVSNEYAQISGPYEAESMNNPDNNSSHFVQEGEGSEFVSGEQLCRCGFGTSELTKQELMLMEVEEHNHRLEILELQEAFQIERIEKMRYLQDLKIQKAELDLQTRNSE